MPFFIVEGSKSFWESQLFAVIVGGLIGAAASIIPLLVQMHNEKIKQKMEDELLRKNQKEKLCELLITYRNDLAGLERYRFIVTKEASVNDVVARLEKMRELYDLSESKIQTMKTLYFPKLTMNMPEIIETRKKICDFVTNQDLFEENVNDINIIIDKLVEDIVSMD